MHKRLAALLCCAASWTCGGKAVIDHGDGGSTTTTTSTTTSTSTSTTTSTTGTTTTSGCGDPTVEARYAECIVADDQASCVAAGGNWGPVGLFPEPVCQCPTGQADCVCTEQSQCLSACIAPPQGGPFECEGLTQGNCSPVSITVGCHCFFFEDGVPEGICVD